MGKMKAPTTKHQAPEKHQISSFNITPALLKFGAWNFSGAWMLGLGAFHL
jgi:hypothetical protein